MTDDTTAGAATDPPETPRPADEEQPLSPGSTPMRPDPQQEPTDRDAPVDDDSPVERYRNSPGVAVGDDEADTVPEPNEPG